MGGRVMTAGELAKLLSEVEPQLPVYGPDGDGVFALEGHRHSIDLIGARKAKADEFGKLVRERE